MNSPWMDAVIQSLMRMTKREKILAGVVLILVTVIVVQQVVLGPYVNRFSSMRNSLRAQRELLNNKQIRTTALAQLQSTKKEFEGILAEVDQQFFNPAESELFVRSLSETLRGFGNDVSVIKPVTGGPVQRRTDLIRQYIQPLGLANYKDVLVYLDAHAPDIDSNGQDLQWMTELQQLVPPHRDKIQILWTQGTDDPLAKLRMKRLDLELGFSGPYDGLILFLQWINRSDKLIQIRQMRSAVSDKVPGRIETQMVISIYVLDMP